MTPDEFLGRVRDLVPAIRERTARAEELRRLPDESWADFQKAGLFRAMQPKRYGGFELNPGTFYQAVMEVAAVCGSSGWIFAVMGAHNWHLALFPPQAQEDVWGADDSVQLSTSLAPTGTIERAEGGFRVRGRWSFSSGCDFCPWVVLGGAVPPAEQGMPPDLRTFLVPRADYEIDDNWHVMGLSGTGSKDIVVKDAFVPEYRTHSYRDAFERRRQQRAALPAALRPCFLLHARGRRDRRRDGRACGISRAAAEAHQHPRPLAGRGRAVHAVAARRVGGRDRRRARPPVAELRRDDAARSRRRENPARVPRALPLGLRQGDGLERAGGRPLDDGERRTRHFLSNPIQRAWRDIHAMQAHASNNVERAAAVYARSEFGLPPTDIRF